MSSRIPIELKYSIIGHATAAQPARKARTFRAAFPYIFLAIRTRNTPSIMEPMLITESFGRMKNSTEKLMP